MAFPNLSAPFLLYTDAALHFVGSVLSQQVEGKEHVIAYASHVLSERTESIFDRELYAIVWSVRHFRHFLLACHPYGGYVMLPHISENCGHSLVASSFTMGCYADTYATLW